VYYTIISRDEFIKLYRFASIRIKYLLADDGNIENRLIKLFKILPLEYEESYLILKIDDTPYHHYNFEKVQTDYTLNIEKIKSVYVLSDEAQHFYQTKVNQKVNFQITPFITIKQEVMKFKKNQDIDKGIDILFKQFNLIDRDKIDKKFDEKFINYYLQTTEYLSKDFKDFYFDLLYYKRENFFPKDDIGFIYDLMVIATLKKRESNKIKKFKNGLLKLDNSSAYKKLNNAKKETLFENIEFIINSDDEDIKKFNNAISNEYLVVGAVFLKIKYLLKEDNRDENTQKEILKIVNDFKNDYIEEVGIALYLIGLVFGYKNLYDYYYDFLELDIFKDAELKSIEPMIKDTIDLRDKELKSLEDKNQKLKLELEKMKEELLNKETLQDNKENLELKEEAKVDELKTIEEEKVESKKDKIKDFITLELEPNLENSEIEKLNMHTLKEFAKLKNIKKLGDYKKEDKIKLYTKIFDKDEDESINQEETTTPSDPNLFEQMN